MAAAPFHILTVCVGNVCRSPLAERLLQQRLDEVAPGRAVVTSAGVGAVVGSGMDPAAAAELARLGGSADGFVARQVTGPILGGADLVLTATRDVRTRALASGPAALRRAFTLPELAAILGSPAFDAAYDDAAGLVGAAARSSRAGRRGRPRRRGPHRPLTRGSPRGRRHDRRPCPDGRAPAGSRSPGGHRGSLASETC